jgi:hypothetical protein
MEHSQYRQFQRRAQEGANVVVFPTGDHDCIGCFADQVKLTRALVQDLDEVVKEVKLLGEHGEEAGQKIMKLEALCKRLREDAQKLKEEKATLEGMVESRDELIMDITKETGLDHMGENVEDDNDRGDATALLFDVAPPLLLRHLLLPLWRTSRKKTPWTWFLSKKPLWHMKLSWQTLSMSCHNPVSIAVTPTFYKNKILST